MIVEPRRDVCPRQPMESELSRPADPEGWIPLEREAMCEFWRRESKSFTLEHTTSRHAHEPVFRYSTWPDEVRRCKPLEKVPAAQAESPVPDDTLPVDVPRCTDVVPPPELVGPRIGVQNEPVMLDDKRMRRLHV